MAVIDRKTITLALQGGGAHGAFTWGILDRLLEDGRLEIKGVSGTSAGAMNAVVLADGLHTGGPDGADVLIALGPHGQFEQGGEHPGQCRPVRFRSAVP